MVVVGWGEGAGGRGAVFKCGVKHEALDIHAASQQALLNEARATARRGNAIEPSAAAAAAARSMGVTSLRGATPKETA